MRPEVFCFRALLSEVEMDCEGRGASGGGGIGRKVTRACFSDKAPPHCREKRIRRTRARISRGEPPGPCCGKVLETASRWPGECGCNEPSDRCGPRF